MDANVCKRGLAAWKRLSKDNNWLDWVQVGYLVAAIRLEALDAAGTQKRPEGKAYNLAFGEMLKRYKLDTMDKMTRSHLLNCMDNHGAIETWRATLAENQRLQWNHPSTVYRHWKKATEPKEEKEAKHKKVRDDHVEDIARDHEIALAKIEELEEKLHEQEFDAADDDLQTRYAQLQSKYEQVQAENARLKRLVEKLRQFAPPKADTASLQMT